MLRNSLAAFTIIALALLMSTHAFAQASVVILKFDVFDASDRAMQVFYDSLHDVIEGSDEMTVQKGGEITLDDLVLTAGCDSPDVECLTGLRSFIEADRMVFGSVKQSGDMYLFTIKMFDFAEARFIREVEDRSFQGDTSQLRDVAPAIIEGLLYGDVGVVNVSVDGSEQAELLINGQRVGFAPTRVENLPLGEVVVMVRTDAGEEDTRRETLRYNQPLDLHFSFTGALMDDRPVADSDRPSLVPAIAAYSVAVLGIGVGVFGLVQEMGVDDSFEELCANGGCEGPGLAAEDHARAIELQSEGDRAVLLQTVGFSVAGVGLAVGTVFLVRSLMYEEAPPRAGLQFDAAPTRDGFQTSLRWRF